MLLFSIVIASEERTRAYVDRVLSSNTFHSAEGLRRLLRYLADKTLSGEAAGLKEYTIGRDAFGKPASYDPQVDPIVRLQAGRLRHKLSEYYLTDGKDDPFVIQLPKGGFRLSFEPRQPGVAPDSASPGAPRSEVVRQTRKWIIPALSVALAVTIAWAVYATNRVRALSQPSVLARSRWTPELEKLWDPFLSAKRPLIMAIEDPMMVEFKGTDSYYRDKSLNRWEDVLQSPRVAAIRKAFNNIEIGPRYYYTALGEVNSVFEISRLLSPDIQNIALSRSSLLSWQQLSDNNVLFIGAPWFFSEQLQDMPIPLEFTHDRAGIHIVHPRPGEPPLLLDQLPTGTAEDGEVYALITRTSGPLGTSDILSFTSDRSPGRMAAVQWFTDPDFARTIVDRIKDSTGALPRYYQLILRVKFKDGVPTATRYVMVKPLSPANGPRHN
jgi:hypothetical protein